MQRGREDKCKAQAIKRETKGVKGPTFNPRLTSVSAETNAAPQQLSETGFSVLILQLTVKLRCEAKAAEAKQILW